MLPSPTPSSLQFYHGCDTLFPMAESDKQIKEEVLKLNEIPVRKKTAALLDSTILSVAPPLPMQLIAAYINQPEQPITSTILAMAYTTDTVNEFQNTEKDLPTVLTTLNSNPIARQTALKVVCAVEQSMRLLPAPFSSFSEAEVRKAALYLSAQTLWKQLKPILDAEKDAATTSKKEGTMAASTVEVKEEAAPAAEEDSIETPYEQPVKKAKAKKPPGEDGSKET